MEWTTEKPTKPGWYWAFHKRRDDEPAIYKVRDYCGEMCIGNWALSDGILWAGPIEPPTWEQIGDTIDKEN